MAFELSRWHRFVLSALAYLAAMAALSLSLSMIIGFVYLGYTVPECNIPCYANSTSDTAMPLETTSQ